MPRHVAKYLIELAAWAALTPLAFILRVEGGVVVYLRAVVVLTLIGIPLKAAVIGWFGLNRQAWRRAGVDDLLSIILGIAVFTFVQVALLHLVRVFIPVPRSVPFIEGLLAVLLLGGTRLALRLWHEQAGQRAASKGGHTRRVLIVGAGEAGLMVVKEMRRHPKSGLVPVGFLDDDAGKARQRINGLAVLGGIDDLPTVAEAHHIDEILIAMPSQPGSVIRQIVTLAREGGYAHRTLPALHDLVSGRVAISMLREVDVEDLLRRDPVRLDAEPIAGYVRGRIVLVTGAGGSIGSEIVRQVAAFGPAHVVLLGRGENSVFEIDRELAQLYPGLRRTAVICDVRDAATLAQVFAQHRPEVVFHAAAHKHVPLMESNPAQAVLNNVAGTRNLVRLALEHGVERFVNVSTDKAVNPTSVMGASKRVAEMVVSDASRRCREGCAFVSVRFGNVLGSRGSVIPIFKEQIRRGEPITVTHPDMVRYFMTIPEASQLVLQAAALAENGRVYVLDMGEPVRIVDLARDLILLSGLKPDQDIPILFSGVRPGEKLFEELLMAEEGTDASVHTQIHVARNAMPPDGLDARLDLLIDAATAYDARAIRQALKGMVPTYDPPSETRAAAPDGPWRAALGLPPEGPVVGTN